jgi:ABC-type xylose transport system permease subunit
VVLLAVWVLAAFFTPNFASRDNFLNVLRQGSFVGVAAIGMTIAIISGTFDLSVGTALALVAWISIWVAARAGVAAAIAVGLAVGMLVGLFNGMLVSKVRIPAFVATLGMFYILRGVAFILSEGAPATFNGASFIWMGNGSIGVLPVPFVVMVVCALIGVGVLRLTTFGLCHATGSNSLAWWGATEESRCLAIGLTMRRRHPGRFSLSPPRGLSRFRVESHRHGRSGGPGCRARQYVGGLAALRSPPTTTNRPRPPCPAGRRGSGPFSRPVHRRRTPAHRRTC